MCYLRVLASGEGVEGEREGGTDGWRRRERDGVKDGGTEGKRENSKLKVSQISNSVVTWAHNQT